MSLVVTADDLGLSAGVTKGVLEAHRRGVVRSASLIVTFPSSAEAAALAHEERGLDVGLHLDLVGGRPVSDPRGIPSLCDEDGRFYALPELTRRLVTGRVRAAEIATELRAQATLARRWGIAPLAWDSHRHVHLIPGIARVVGRLAHDEGVRWLRRARAPRSWSHPKAAALRVASALASAAFRGVGGNDWYVDLTGQRPRLDPAGVALLATYPGIGEIGAHPGYVDNDLRARDPLTHEREADLALLTDPLLVRALGPDAVRWRVRP